MNLNNPFCEKGSSRKPSPGVATPATIFASF
jgi:hypothetical protein